MPPDIGLIGATAIAERAVLRPAARRDDVRVRAVAAGDPARARAFAERNGIARVHDDYAALVDDPAVDTVYVSLHNSAHHRWAVRAAERGKHVVVEKPLCLGPDQLAGIAGAAARTGARVAEAVPTAGHPWQEAVREMVADRRYGRLRCVRTELCFGEPPAGSYRDRPDLGGGIFLDTASYWLQAVQSTVGLAGATGEGRVEETGPLGADRAFRARLGRPDGTEAVLVARVGERLVAEHEFVFEAASVRLRNFLRPLAGPLPLNLAVVGRDGGTTIRSFPPVAYYDRQLDRLCDLLGGPAAAGAAELAATAERIALMAAVHAHARSGAAR
jgi:predicted dehydrogenase